MTNFNRTQFNVNGKASNEMHNDDNSYYVFIFRIKILSSLTSFLFIFFCHQMTKERSIEHTNIVWYNMNICLLFSRLFLFLLRNSQLHFVQFVSSFLGLILFITMDEVPWREEKNMAIILAQLAYQTAINVWGSRKVEQFFIFSFFSFHSFVLYSIGHKNETIG